MKPCEHRETFLSWSAKLSGCARAVHRSRVGTRPRQVTGAPLSEHRSEVGSDAGVGGGHGFQLASAESERDGESEKVDQFGVPGPQQVGADDLVAGSVDEDLGGGGRLPMR